MQKPKTLQDWQKMFREIYLKKDQRDYNLSDLLLHVQEEAALIDEGLRKIDENGKQEIIDALPKMFCWLLSFCNMACLDLEIMVLGKYSGCCPYCGKEENCMCITGEVKPDRWYAAMSNKRIRDLYGLQKMFKNIYGRINKISPFMHIWLHVHEELGEFSREWRLERGEQAADEMADCFAWLLAFCNKLHINLGEITWKKYPGTCNVCGKTECQCSKV
jgi:NTP pyrophosphatase (non-canonical NTP hydrolase)